MRRNRNNVAPAKVRFSLEDGFRFNEEGNAYFTENRFEEALEQYLLSREILEWFLPDSLDLAIAHKNIGAVYNELGRKDEALEQYQIAVDIQERKAPNSPELFQTYDDIEKIHETQRVIRELQESNRRLFKQVDQLRALTHNLIAQVEEVSHKINADDHNKAGVVHYKNRLLEEALKEYQLALKITEQEDPDSIQAADSYFNIAMVYSDQGRLEESLDLYEKSFRIYRKHLPRSHPQVISAAFHVAQTAYDLGKYDAALEFANWTTTHKKNYKYGYDIKGLILQKQFKYQEALNCFGEALAIDPGYRDAMVHKLALEVEIAPFSEERIEDRDLLDQIEVAKKLPQTEYDEKYEIELEAGARSSGDKDEGISARSELPQQEYAGEDKYIAALENLAGQISDVRRDHEVTKEKVEVLEHRVDEVETRMDIFEDRLYSLADSLDITKRAQLDIEKREKENSADQSILRDFARERARWLEREKKIKEFNKDPDQRHYYNALLSEMVAAFIAAQVIGSNKVEMQGSQTYSKAGEYLGMLVSIAPFVGNLASTVAQKIGIAADLYKDAITQKGLLRIRELAPTIEEFEKIALRVAVEITQIDSIYLWKLKGKKVDKDWKSHLGAALSGGLQELMERFVQDNDTEAKLLGRAKGQKVIAYLQEEAVAENLSLTDPVSERRPYLSYYSLRDKEEGQTKYTMIAKKISSEILLREMKEREIVSDAVAGAKKSTKPSPNTSPKKGKSLNQGSKDKACVVS